MSPKPDPFSTAVIKGLGALAAIAALYLLAALLHRLGVLR